MHLLWVLVHESRATLDLDSTALHNATFYERQMSKERLPVHLAPSIVLGANYLNAVY